MKLNTKLFLLLFTLVGTTVYTADTIQNDAVPADAEAWIPGPDGFMLSYDEAHKEYAENSERAEYSGINIDCDDLLFCKHIKSKNIKKALEALPLTAPGALNIASIEATPILVWLIQNNDKDQHSKLIKELIYTEGIDIEKSHFIKRVTPLHAAAQTGQVEILNDLLIQNHSLDAVTKFYRDTPKDLAFKAGHQNIVNILERWMKPKERSRTHTEATAIVSIDHSENSSPESSPKKLHLEPPLKGKP